MRLWHQKLIPLLPRQQLLGQHREYCALRGAGWGRSHSTVNYVFNHSPNKLVAYHNLIMNEMVTRGYNPDPIWRDAEWRGKKLGKHKNWSDKNKVLDIIKNSAMIYSEHNKEYLTECLINLKEKGIILNVI